MVGQTARSPLTFDEFVNQYPENGGRYELRWGEVVEMRPIGPHEKVSALVARKLDFEIERLGLPLFMPRTCLVKVAGSDINGYLPDLIVLDEVAVESDPYWHRQSSISLGSSAKLVVEVVSTNWQDDYAHKLADYEQLGIPEYWIVDYLGLGGVRYIGSLKLSMITVYLLVNDEYAGEMFRVGDRLISPQFPALNLMADQIFAAGK
jgi:Uma2 family endonuclease